MNPKKHLTWFAACMIQALALAGLAGGALAQSHGATKSHKASTTNPESSRDAAAIEQVADSADVVRRMGADPAVSGLLAKAKGVYIVPTSGRTALGLGASGGTGVLSVRRSDGNWSDPAFFNVGGMNAHPQAGAEGGPIALILLSDKAIDAFNKKNKFALGAEAGLTVANFAVQAQGAVGTSDVVAWASSKGLFGDAANLSFKGIHFNKRANHAYYGRDVLLQDIISGKVTDPHSDALKKALASASGGSK